MSRSSESIARLVRLCVVEGRSGPWTDLISGAEQIIRSAFISAGGTPRDLEEFLDWFSGWLFHERKLPALIRSLAKKEETGECLDTESQDAFTCNYFVRIVASGKAEFHAEKQPREKPVDPLVLSQRVDETVDRTESIESNLDDVKQAIAGLPPEIRIPFRLKYYAACGPLASEEEQWISERSSPAGESVARIVDQEFNDHRERKYPLSSEFIGELLGIPPSPTGRNTTVDQRVTRALAKLREILGGGDE